MAIGIVGVALPQATQAEPVEQRNRTDRPAAPVEIPVPGTLGMW